MYGFVSREIKNYTGTYFLALFLVLVFVIEHNYLHANAMGKYSLSIKGGIKISEILTSIISHLSIVHLLKNVFGLVITGRYIERRFSFKNLIFVYTFGAIFANISFVSFIYLSGYKLPIIGSSGGIYSLFAFMVIDFYRSKEIIIKYIPSIIFLIIISDQLHGLLTRELNGVFTAYTAHISGAIFGIIVYSVLTFSNKRNFISFHFYRNCLKKMIYHLFLL